MALPEVQFHSTAFNVSEPREHFINPCCFGDDVCNWLIAELRARGMSTDDAPGQEDFGWYFNFDVGGKRHCFLITFQPNDAATGDRWIGWIERQRGLAGTLLGRRSKEIDAAAIGVIDEILTASANVTDVVWST